MSDVPGIHPESRLPGRSAVLRQDTRHHDTRAHTGATHVDRTHGSASPSKTVGVRAAETTPMHMHVPQKTSVPQELCAPNKPGPQTPCAVKEQALDPPPGAWTQRCPPSRRASSDRGHDASERKDPRGPSCGPRGLLPASEVTLSILMCTGPFVQTMSPETPPQPPEDSARVVDRLRAESPPLTQAALLPLPRQEMEHLGSAVIFLNRRFLP